jgi:hypothetical protein
MTTSSTIETIDALETETRRLHPSRSPGTQPTLSIRATVSKDDVSEFIAAALHDIRAYMEEHHATVAGPPFSICRGSGSTFDVEAGWPVAQAIAGTSRIHSGTLPTALVRPAATVGSD